LQQPPAKSFRYLADVRPHLICNLAPFAFAIVEVIAGAIGLSVSGHGAPPHRCFRKMCVARQPGAGRVFGPSL